MHEIEAAVIGAGPAGLMAATRLVEAGIKVTIFDAMPSAGRKFLMAGKSGLNITHAEAKDLFLTRYSSGDGITADPRLLGMVNQFSPKLVQDWMASLAIPTHTGPTGRVFPAMMKASPLLRAWLARLEVGGAQLLTRHRWQGWDEDGSLSFATPTGKELFKPKATILGLGGASWRRLGSDGLWTTELARRNVSLAPFVPSNCGFLVDWSDHITSRFAGSAVKSVRLSSRGETTRAEFVITRNGVESGGIYTLSRGLRRELAEHGHAILTLDLLPDINLAALVKRLERPRGKQSVANFLRKTVHLSGVKLALLHEVAPKDVFDDPQRLAEQIKALPIKLVGMAPMDEAISTAGGVAWSALDDGLMLKELPGVFCAGEMIDWDAPTGGYLLTACLATGNAAGQAAAAWIANNP